MQEKKETHTTGADKVEKVKNRCRVSNIHELVFLQAKLTLNKLTYR